MTLRPAKSWKSTLRLPKSSFPARPQLADQPRYLKRCTDDLYEWQSRERAAQEPFLLHDGPPYANGPLHLGHALNKILKDLVCRVKVQQGRRVNYVPGWDCHGLPIEIKALEKQRDQHKDEEGILDPIGVRQGARSLATRTVKQQMKGFREWGVMADWDKAWTTMDKSFEVKQLGVFQEMVKRGLISRRYKPVYWSPSSRTALAEAELEYKYYHMSTAAYVKFPLTSVPEDLKRKLPENGILHAVIWTTTPWTLPANRAIGVHRDMEYSVVKKGSDLLLMSRQQTLLLVNATADIVVESILGGELKGSQYVNVLRGKESVPQPIIHADFVSAESGSGLVHLAPGHGMEDYDVCSPLGIKPDAPVNNLGCFTSAALPDDPQVLEGKSVLDEGSSEVLKILGDKVLAVYEHKHKYPYDWRTKLPVIVRATEQWFADVGSVKDQALSSLDEVRFIPESGRARLESFVEGRSEWCISRQRAWGVPIPAIYNEDGVAVLTDESVAHLISVVDERGIDAWWTDRADDPAWIVPGLEGKYRRGKDTMDVWFDSGTSWTQSHQRADVYLEGTDQHRGWFQSSLLTYVSASGTDGAPFKTCITHGFTLDQSGKKMSKSIGNTIAPSQIIDGSLLPSVKNEKTGQPISKALGPDALRLWVAASDYTRDLSIGQDVLQSNHNALSRYRLILKMLLGSMHPSARTAPITKLDQIALAQLQASMTEVASSYDNFEFYKGISALNKWINNDLSAFYIEAMKDRLYCGDGGGVVEEIFHGLLRMLTPITPILVEEAWDHRPEWMKVESQAHPFHRTLDDPIISPARAVQTDSLVGDISWLMYTNTAIKTAQEEARAKKLMGASIQCSVVLQIPSQAGPLFDRYADELDTIFIVSSVELNGDVEGAWKYSCEFDAPGGKGTAWVLPPKGHKCSRCWRHVAPVENELCGRCEEVVKLS